MGSSYLSSLILGTFLLNTANMAQAQAEQVDTANTTPTIATDFLNDSILPPITKWQGKSENLLISPDSEWATPFEKNGLKTSPNYDDTFVWLDKLIATSPMLNKVSLGKSPQGRDIWMIVAAKNGTDSAKVLIEEGKPSVLVQAGIHSGEIDGKDAGMMLLRDMVLGDKAHLLNKANLLFVPIFNVDGHERNSQYNRVNQRGPVNMGWRTTANNLNLNRDYAKADTIEMQHMLKAINEWQPSLYIDVHVTDGIDYQYDLTFGYNLSQGLSPASFRWLDNQLKPALYSALEDHGHIPGELVFAQDNRDLSQGVSLWNPGPRYSNGYGDARHLPTILVENHSLKPFKQRVLATYVMLEQTLVSVGQQATKLKSAIEQDKYRYPSRVTLTWNEERQAKGRDFKGIEYHLEQSPISGDQVVRWTGKPKLYPNLPVMSNTVPAITTTRPSAYYVPPQWQQVIERLATHGIRMSRISKPITLKLEQYRLTSPEFGAKDYEGHQRVKTGVELNSVTKTLPEGTVKISTEQPLGDLAILLLEPQAKDSFLQWGFFNPIFTRTEYIEEYAVEPLAAKMLTEDPKLAQAFEIALKDEEFAADSRARLRWFYERSPYYDGEYQIYPVLRAK